MKGIIKGIIKIILILTMEFILFPSHRIWASEMISQLHVDVQTDDGTYVLWKENDIYTVHDSLYFIPRVMGRMKMDDRIIVCSHYGKRNVSEIVSEGEQYCVLLPMYEECDVWFYLDYSDGHREESRHYRFRRVPDESEKKGLFIKRVYRRSTFLADKNMID